MPSPEPKGPTWPSLQQPCSHWPTGHRPLTSTHTACVRDATSPCTTRLLPATASNLVPPTPARRWTVAPPTTAQVRGAPPTSPASFTPGKVLALSRAARPSKPRRSPLEGTLRSLLWHAPLPVCGRCRERVRAPAWSTKPQAVLRRDHGMSGAPCV